MAPATYPVPTRATPYGTLFGLASGGVYLAAYCYQKRGALLPHHFNLTCSEEHRRYIFCCTCRRLTPPRRYLAPCSVKSGLSSPYENHRQRLSGQLCSKFSRRTKKGKENLTSLPFRGKTWVWFKATSFYLTYLHTTLWTYASHNRSLLCTVSKIFHDTSSSCL